MAAHKDEKVPASGVATRSLSAPNNGSPVDVNGCTYHNHGAFVSASAFPVATPQAFAFNGYTYHNYGAFVSAPAFPAATPQAFAYVPCEVTAVPRWPNGQVIEAWQRAPLVHPAYYAMLGVLQPIQMAEVMVPAPISVVPCSLYQVVNVTWAAEQDQSQTQSAIPAAQTPMPTAPAYVVQRGASATSRAATQVTDFPVPVHTAAGAVPAASMPATNQQGVSGARRMMPSQMTVDDVAVFIGQLRGCAPYVEVFRRHQVDGQALLLMCMHHLILDMQIKFGPALKIEAAIKSLKRAEEKGLMRPPL